MTGRRLAPNAKAAYSALVSETLQIIRQLVCRLIKRPVVTAGQHHHDDAAILAFLSRAAERSAL
jgi:hypothetical protein